MRVKTLLTALRHAALAAVLIAMPALAQQVPPGPVCANCHAEAYTSTVMTPHGAKNDVNGTMCMACHGDASAPRQGPDEGEARESACRRRSALPRRRRSA